MNITTRFNVGQTVWLIRENSVTCGMVQQIKIEVNAYSNKGPLSDNTVIQYAIDVVDWRGGKAKVDYRESVIYGSKADLLSALSEEADFIDQKEIKK